jgi:pantoate--beta-alanine ligase
MAAASGGDMGFVPTMGAFHAGHIALMRESGRHHPITCVSLFVNPLQFGPKEDLAKYPRDEARDFELADQARVDIMFAPPPSEVYPRESTSVHVPALGDCLEGAVRPGHFDGVATVVAKLFNIVRPKVAYFGWKDLQQCLVIRRMVEDLNMPLRLQFLETVRETDGLAMSSRNAYLSPDQRKVAPRLYQTIAALAESIESAKKVNESEVDRAREKLRSYGFEVDYLQVVSTETLLPTLNPPSAAIVGAARLGTTRLIDNYRLTSM